MHKIILKTAYKNSRKLKYYLTGLDIVSKMVLKISGGYLYKNGYIL